MATPEQVTVRIGLDVGKESHFADVLDNDGERMFSRAIGNDQGDIEALLDRAGRHGVPGLAIDQPGSIAQLVLAVAAKREAPVAYVPGLVMRRAADLYPGKAKTDRRDAYIIADTARTRQSGTSLNAETRSRRGNHRLKNAMFRAAFCSLRDPESRAFCERKRAEGKRHNAAIICLARRRCDVILAMLSSRQPYQPDRKKAAKAA